MEQSFLELNSSSDSPGIPDFPETNIFFVVLTRTRCLSLSWARLIQFTPSVYLWSVLLLLLLSSHVTLYLQSSLFPPYSHTKATHVLSFFPPSLDCFIQLPVTSCLLGGDTFPILDTLSPTVVCSSTCSYLLYVYMSPVNCNSKARFLPRYLFIWHHHIKSGCEANWHPFQPGHKPLSLGIWRGLCLFVSYLEGCACLNQRSPGSCVSGDFWNCCIVGVKDRMP